MMTDKELQKIEDQLRHYQSSFKQNGQSAPMQLLKLKHCLRVADNCLHIAQSQEYNHQQQNLAKAIGLLHDVARFQQWQEYGTFSDKLSEDHGDLGAKILAEKTIIDHLTPRNHELIIYSVRFHNKKDIPQCASHQERKYLEIIREADRLDITFVILEAIENGTIYRQPEILWNTDLHGPASQVVAESLEQGQSIHYTHLRTLSDWVLLHLQWIQRLSFVGSVHLVQARNYLGRLQQIMPDNSEKVEVFFTEIQAHLQARCEP